MATNLRDKKYEDVYGHIIISILLGPRLDRRRVIRKARSDAILWVGAFCVLPYKCRAPVHTPHSQPVRKAPSRRRAMRRRTRASLSSGTF
jgi:hypothetical protein